MTKDKTVIYPIIITKDNKDKLSYLVSIPTLDGLTQGSSVSDSISMAEYYIGTYSLEDELPESVYILPKVDKNSITTLVKVNISQYKRLHDNKVIKKTLTIPNYSNELGTQNKIKFSEILTEALKNKLEV